MHKKKTLSLSTPLVPPFTPPDADTIQKSISSVERHIADEKLQLMKVRRERERANWQEIVAGKDEEIADLRRQWAEAQDRLASLRKEYVDMQAIQLEHVEAVVKELDLRRAADKKKIEAILSEVKIMTDMAVAAQSKVVLEQEKLHQTRKSYAHRQQHCDEQMRRTAEELADLQELSVKKEESWLKEKTALTEDIHRLSEEVFSLKETLASEKARAASALALKTTEAEKLKSGIQDAILQMTQERQRFVELQKQFFASKQQANELQEQVRRLQQDAQLAAAKQSLPER